MNQVLYKSAFLVLFVLTVAALGASNALAVRPVSDITILLGNDISWPQCKKSFPTKQAFGIVGVNNGLANTTNPCLSSQLKWADKSSGGTGQDKAALYVNTANPGLKGTFWPYSNSYNGMTIGNPYGTCNHQNNAACAYIYGYAKAYDDATIRGVATPTKYTWWLDVETVNSWQSNTTANRADLEGMTAYFQALGVRKIGIYSTGYQWRQIVGEVGSNSNLYALPSWLAGASSEVSAMQSCELPPLTSGSQVVLTQFTSGRSDYNFSCI